MATTFQTLTITSIATGRIECAAMRMREQMPIVGAFEQAAGALCGQQKTAAHPLDSALLAAKIRDVRRPVVLAGDLLMQG